MPVTTAAAAFHIAPIAIKTFIRHTRKKTHKLAGRDTGQEATDDIFYDECVFTSSPPGVISMSPVTEAFISSGLF